MRVRRDDLDAFLTSRDHDPVKSGRSSDAIVDSIRRGLLPEFDDVRAALDSQSHAQLAAALNALAAAASSLAAQIARDSTR